MSKKNEKDSESDFDLLCFLSICFDEAGMPRNEPLDWLYETALEYGGESKFWYYLYVFTNLVRKTHPSLLSFSAAARPTKLTFFLNEMKRSNPVSAAV